MSATGLPMLPVRFVPSKETLAVLNDRSWVCSYSGGKDSTSLVTWIEWLRRVGLAKCSTPRLVMSDTTVEYPFLRGIADRVMAALTASGWACEIVTPRQADKLYCQIFGRGLPPTHPGQRKRTRWCTRSTKGDPMKRFARTVGPDVVQLSGVRWGESDNRDGKLKASGCAAGGECGLPEPGEGIYSPIITWKMCKVIEWLGGEAGDEVNAVLLDLLPMMRALLDVYEVRKESTGMFDVPPKVSSLRFGCVGCPAISKEKIISGKEARKRPEWAHLYRIYAIWSALYEFKTRCARVLPSGKVRYGPLRMAVRKQYFTELLDIQEKAGVTLVTPEDIAFIRDCWERKVYPRGWSEADELVEPPDDGLFAGMGNAS